MIKQLTPEQEAKLADYVREGLRIGLATGDGTMDEALVRELTDKHRVMCGYKPATRFVVYDSPYQALANEPEITPYNALYGQHDISWLIHYSFYRNELGLVEETAQIVHLLELAEHVNWFWLGQNSTIACHRPVDIQLAERERPMYTHTHPSIKSIPHYVLHNPNGKALTYKDGSGVYMSNGVAMDAVAELMDKPNLEFSEVMKVSNTQQRAELLKKLDVRKLIAEEKLPIRVLDTHPEKTRGRLVQLTDEGFEDYVMLEMVCPSSGEIHVECVPPDCTTVDQAHAWRIWGTVDIPADKIYPEVES